MDDPKVTESATMSADGDSHQDEGVFASDDNREITGNNGHLLHRQRRQWAKARQAGTHDARHMPSSRRVSFPKHDSELVTGYLEPANPWAICEYHIRPPCPSHNVSRGRTHTFTTYWIIPTDCLSTPTAKPNLSAKELIELYRKSCSKHDVEPLMVVIKHLETMDFQNMTPRSNSLVLRENKLTPQSCEALEEILKRVCTTSLPLGPNLQIHSTKPWTYLKS